VAFSAFRGDTMMLAGGSGVVQKPSTSAVVMRPVPMNPSLIIPSASGRSVAFCLRMQPVYAGRK
jgi:hypothetical protein